MKITTESKRITIELPSGRMLSVKINFPMKTFERSIIHAGDEIDTVLKLRTYASELSQIAQLVQDELNKVHGYEFNEEVENVKSETLKEIINSVNEETEEDKLRKIYFALYDQMEEPERSQAKANWSDEWDKYKIKPTNISDSLWAGCIWDKTPQKHEYWKRLCFEKYANK